MKTIFGFAPETWWAASNPAQIATLLLLAPLFLHSSTLLSISPLYVYDSTRYATLAFSMVASLYLALKLPRVGLTHTQVLGASLVCGSIVLSLLANYDSSIRLEAAILIMLVAVGLQYHHALVIYGTRHVVDILGWTLVAASLLYTVHAVAMILPHCLFDNDCLYLNTGPMGFENRRTYNDIQALMIPALLWFMVQANRRPLAVFLGFLASVQLAHLLVTSGRAAMLGILAGLAVTWFASKWPPRHYWRLLATLSAAALIFGSLVFFDGAPSGYSTSLRTSDSGRLDLWATAILGGVTSPLFGQGPGSFAQAGHSVAGAHNVFLGVLHDYGVPLFLFSLAFVFLVFSRLKPGPQPLLSFFAVSLLSIWLFTSAIHPLITITSLILLALLTSEGRDHAALKRSVPSIWLLALVSAALALSLVDTPPMREPPFIFRPRIWLGT